MKVNPDLFTLINQFREGLISARDFQRQFGKVEKDDYLRACELHGRYRARLNGGKSWLEHWKEQEEEITGMRLFDFVETLESELTDRLKDSKRIGQVQNGIREVYPNWDQLLFAVQAFKQLKAVNLANQSVADLNRFLTTRDSLDEVDSYFYKWSSTGVKNYFPIKEEEN